MKRIIALFMSDPHLSLTAPIWRSAEPDWLTAQARPFEELNKLQQRYDCPIFCAGDIFDKWCGSTGSGGAELINWAIEHLPHMFAIPGQHDLPNHNSEDIERSAFWTLHVAGIIEILNSDNWKYIGRPFGVRGFHFGEKIDCTEDFEKFTAIALIHQYNCIKRASYPGAPIESFVSKSRKEFKGYDIVVCGDNHHPFECMIGKTLFWNAGCFLRRHSNEADYKPRIGMLTEDGEMISHYLDISKDKYLTNEDTEKEISEMDITDLMKELNRLGSTKADFEKSVEIYLKQHGSSKAVQKIIAEAIGI